MGVNFSPAALGLAEGFVPPGSSAQYNLGSTAIIPGMADFYKQNLGLQQQNYQTVLGMLMQRLGGIPGDIGSAVGQFNQGTQTALGSLGGTADNPWGVALPAAQAIGEQFAGTDANIQNQAISAGLGGTTIPGNFRNQNALMAGRAYGNLGAELARTRAGYQFQGALSGLGAQMQGLGMQNQLTGTAAGILGNIGQFPNRVGNLAGGFNQGLGASHQWFGGGYGGGISGGGGIASPYAGTNFGSTYARGGFNPYGDGPVASGAGAGWMSTDIGNAMGQQYLAQQQANRQFTNTRNQYGGPDSGDPAGQDTIPGDISTSGGDFGDELTSGGDFGPSLPGDPFAYAGGAGGDFGGEFDWGA